MGIAVDFPIDATIKATYTQVNDNRSEKRHVSVPVQFLTAAGLGLQFKFNQHLGIYVEPSAQWYVPTSSNLETYRTEHPFMFAIPVGLRLTL